MHTIFFSSIRQSVFYINILYKKTKKKKTNKKLTNKRLEKNLNQAEIMETPDIGSDSDRFILFLLPLMERSKLGRYRRFIL